MTNPLRHISDAQRRARLATRHALTQSNRVASPAAATAAMTVLHATEPATVYLSCWARVHGLQIVDVDVAFLTDRTLMKQLAMRRTLFVFPRDLLPAAWPSASARVARSQRSRMAKDLVRAGITNDGNNWLDQAQTDIAAVLANTPNGLSTQEIRRRVPRIDVTIAAPGAEPWSAPQLLTYLGATAHIVRGVHDGRFPAPRPRWTLTGNWLDNTSAPWTAPDGYRELVRRWLHAFGPGTEEDIVWWLGATKTVVRDALAELDAVPVSLDGDGRGWLLPGDLDDVPTPDPWVALLPVLDATTMGWKQRNFFLGNHATQVFDNRGNAGTTAWVNGSVVGCWVQDDNATVQVRLLEHVATPARQALDREGARLTAWLDGTQIGTGYKSPAMKDPAPAPPSTTTPFPSDQTNP